METHDEQNKAGPPKEESSSVFRGGPISQSNTRSNGQMHDRQASNPYRLVQSMRKDSKEERPETATSGSRKIAELWQQIKHRLLPENAGAGDTKQKVMVVLIPILFIVMIFTFRQVLSKSPRKTKGATNDNTSVVTAVHSDGEIDWQIPEQIPMGLRDPIKPSSRTTMTTVMQTDSNSISSLDMLSVRGILYSHDKPSAVIGNQIVHLNDKIDDATVVEIERDFVIFEKDGKRWMKKVAELEMEQQKQLWKEQKRETDKIQS